MTPGDRGYRYLVGSDIQRDGMFMEMRDANGDFVAEVFYCDITSKMSVTLEVQELPIEAVEELLSKARRQLPPRQNIEATTPAVEPTPAKL